MGTDYYNLKGKSDTELHEWLAGHESKSDEYLAGIEELMERNDAPASRREWIAMSIAVISIAVAVLAIVTLYE